MLDAAGHRELAVALFNRTWELLEKGSDRSVVETDELVHAAHASCYHWSKTGTLANLARGEWQIARVYAELGLGDSALRHAQRCVELEADAEAAGVAEDWDRAAAFEVMTRAQLVAGDRAAAATWRLKAKEALDAIADAEDREQIERDLDSLRI